MIDAPTALSYGLVNHVVKIEELLETCKSILTTINSKAPLTIKACIQSANAVFDHTINGFDMEISTFGECFGTNDMKEGTQAFIEKRKPVFKGN